MLFFFHSERPKFAEETEEKLLLVQLVLETIIRKLKRKVMTATDLLTKTR